MQKPIYAENSRSRTCKQDHGRLGAGFMFESLGKFVEPFPYLDVFRIGNCGDRTGKFRFFRRPGGSWCRRLAARSAASHPAGTSRLS